MEKGYVQVYTGNGKGKTTAALGLALRAVGHGLRVLMIQFTKGQRDYGELRAAERLAPYLTIAQMGRDKFVSKDHPASEDIELARKGFAAAREAVESKSYDIVILDEINVAVDYGLVALSDLLNLLDHKPDGVEIILTGRNAKPEVLERAHLVTEMVEKKHYYTQGVRARKGVER